MYIVILGGGSTIYQNGSLPGVNEINEVFTLCLDNNEDLKLILVDRNLLYANNIANGKKGLTQSALRNSEFEELRNLTSPNTFIENDAEKISGFMVILGINFSCEVIHKHKIKSEILNTSESIIFIDKTGLTSTYEIMNMIGSYVINKRYFILSNDERNLYEIVDNYFDKFLTTPFDFYYGGQISENIQDFDLRDIKKQIKVGCEIIKQYLKAGYHQQRLYDNVNGYAINVETPVLKGLIYTYGLFPKHDMSPYETIVKSAIYRYQLFDLLLRLLSNFAINNGLLTMDTVMEKGGWYIPEIYDAIIKNL